MKKIIIGLFLAVIAAAALGASTTGKVEGTVLDAAGTPLAEVAVSIVSQTSSAVKFEVVTDASGRFVQIGIQPGYYMISFKKESFAPVSKEVHVGIEETTKLEVKIDKVEAAVEMTLSESDKLFLKGNALYQDKKYDEALAAYREAVALSGNQWSYYLNLGLTYKKLDNKDDASAAFAKAVELNPDSYSANKEYGEILAKAGNAAEARKYYQKASELSPDDPDAFFNLGACLTNSGENEAALAAFRKCVEIKTDYADAYFQMGTINIGLNMKDEAVADLEKFLELAPNHEKADLAKKLLDYLKK